MKLKRKEHTTMFENTLALASVTTVPSRAASPSTPLPSVYYQAKPVQLRILKLQSGISAVLFLPPATLSQPDSEQTSRGESGSDVLIWK